MPKSKVSEDFTFNEEVWVVSILNTGAKMSGHSVILVEGIKDGAAFVRQCDITAELLPEETKSIIREPFRNVKGKINQVRIFESYHPTLEYDKKSSRSVYADPESVLLMLNAIEQDRDTTIKAQRGEGLYLQYEYSGRYSMFSSGAADNCPTWCYEKLKIAGINITPVGFDYIKAMPEKHVKPGVETTENTLEAATNICRLL